jgi:small subunit ribosomal protein S16
MAVRIRLKRTGAKNKPCYRIVVADARSQRDGRFIENLGFYDPRHEDEKIDVERADYWLSVGAKPTETVESIIKRAKGESKPVVEKKQEVKKEEAAE